MACRILDHHYFMQDISVVACELLVSACGIQFPDQGSNTGLLLGSLSHWTTREVLPHSFFFFFFLSHFIIYFWLYQVMVAVQTFLQLQRTGATVMHRLPIVVASLVVETGYSSCGTWGQQLGLLQSTGTTVAAHGLSCSAACGIFLDQGSNLCLLQVDSLPLSHQGSLCPIISYSTVLLYILT